MPEPIPLPDSGFPDKKNSPESPIFYNRETVIVQFVVPLPAPNCLLRAIVDCTCGTV
jgi:hypothetical protein